MAQTLKFHELKQMTVGGLRDIAKTLPQEALQGYTQMNKEHLLSAICTALNIPMHEHHEVIGIDKTQIKAAIRDLKHRRDDAIAAHDGAQLHDIRRRIHYLRRALRKRTV